MMGDDIHTGDATLTEWNNNHSKVTAHFPRSGILMSVKCRLPAETEDVAHIPVHVHTVLLLTYDLTNCQTHWKATLQPSQLVHSQILLIL